MSKFVKLKKGFNINLAGVAKKRIVDSITPNVFALKPTDFNGIERPKLSVAEGDTVKAGSPLMFDKIRPEVKFTAPVSGEVVEIRRGDRRKLLEIKILPDQRIEYENFHKYTISAISTLSREDILKQLLPSGIWPRIIQRPYGVIANPADKPKAIFISTFDSHPLAPGFDFILKGEEQHFQTGLDILRRLTPGKVHLNIDSDAEVSPLFGSVTGVQVNKFSGPHPAGNVGVQIHHLDPINKGDIAWTISPYGVTQIGKLFLEGIYDASKIFALAGPPVKEPQYYKTFDGACIDQFINNGLSNDNVRIISGNALTGERISADGYLGYHDHLVTVLTEGNHSEFIGWILPTSKKLSFHRAFGLFSFMNRDERYDLDTNTYGEERAFVQTGVFERVTPMDILPTHLLKAIMAEDYDDMEALGIYEVIEEDLALCEFVDVSKHPIQSIVRDGIDLMLEG
ncbi:MAG: Na(+)-translocating NADH-quinone reductase subunit A [Cyclobacteriaceae bacterium]|nr:MAG: Na(+)-translocating NADH-quinone reductase subunit A [Cyclobacteriaceae bacterium]